MQTSLPRPLLQSAIRPSALAGGPASLSHPRLPSRCAQSRPTHLPPGPPGSRARQAYYHSASSPSAAQSPYSPTEREILTAALQHVPASGFTQQTLAKGADAAGYPPTSLALFPRGVYELVFFHLVTQRLGLKDQLSWHGQVGDSSATHLSQDLQSRLRHTILARLKGNAPVVQHLTQAIAIMSLAKNIPPSLAELGRLSDEILYLAGDTSVDSTWYLKRGAVAGVYAATETFMTQDQSTDFKDTVRFLDRRLEDVRGLGQGAADVGQFLGYAGISTINILRSWNVRI